MENTLVDALLLSRIHYSANITFHILFPTITLTLAWLSVFVKIRFTTSRSQLWMRVYRYWVKVFVLSFALFCEWLVE